MCTDRSASRKRGPASIHSSISLRHWQALLRIEMKSAEQESHSRPIAMGWTSPLTTASMCQSGSISNH